jgi:dynein heavy chain
LKVKASLKSLMGSVHVAVTSACAEYHERFRRHVHVTPKSYMSFLNSYRRLYAAKLAEAHELAAQINNGLQKMSDAKVDVNRMKVRACMETRTLEARP